MSRRSAVTTGVVIIGAGIIAYAVTDGDILITVMALVASAAVVVVSRADRMSRTPRNPSPAWFIAWWIALALILAAVTLGLTGVISSRAAVGISAAALFLGRGGDFGPLKRSVVGAMLAVAGSAGLVLNAQRGEDWPILLAASLFASAGALGLLSGIAAVGRSRRALHLHARHA